jgi:rubredoxin
VKNGQIGYAKKKNNSTREFFFAARFPDWCCPEAFYIKTEFEKIDSQKIFE